MTCLHAGKHKNVRVTPIINGVQMDGTWESMSHHYTSSMTIPNANHWNPAQPFAALWQTAGRFPWPERNRWSLEVSVRQLDAC